MRIAISTTKWKTLWALQKQRMQMQDQQTTQKRLAFEQRRQETKPQQLHSGPFAPLAPVRRLALRPRPRRSFSPLRCSCCCAFEHASMLDHLTKKKKTIL